MWSATLACHPRHLATRACCAGEAKPNNVLYACPGATGAGLCDKWREHAAWLWKLRLGLLELGHATAI